MSKQIDSVETRISPEPRINIKVNNTVSQEGKLGRRSILSGFLPRTVLAAMAGAGGLATVIGIDPVALSESASAANTEITRADGTKLTLLKNPGGDIDTVMYLFPGTTIETARQLTEGIDMVEPLKSKYSQRFRFWTVPLTYDPRCDLVDVTNGCNPEDVKKEIKLTNATVLNPNTNVFVKGMINGGAGSATLTDPLKLTEADSFAYSLIITPPIPRQLDKLGYVHETVGHGLLKLADARLINKSKTNVGRGYANCTRDPEYWKRLYGITYTNLKGCESDKEAYTIDDMMNRVSTSGGKFAPELDNYIDSVMKQLPAGLSTPGLKIASITSANIKDGLVEVVPDTFKASVSSVEEAKSPDMGYTLIVDDVPSDATCAHVQVLPAANIYSNQPDGPGYDNILCGQENFTKIPFPKPEIGKGSYFNLPGMSYIAKVQLSKSLVFVGKPEDPKWKWDVRKNIYTNEEYVKEIPPLKIIMPSRGSEKITPVSPQEGEVVGPQTTIQWKNGDEDVFYYEVRVSRDKMFKTDPKEAEAAVYWNLVHGGETSPINSWKIPQGFGLEEGINYFQARPRIQGDGTPAQWSKPFQFTVSKDAPNKRVSQGWPADADYGNGVIGPSQEDIDRFGR